MGSIQDLPRNGQCVRDESLHRLANARVDGDHFLSFKVIDLGSDMTKTPTGMREEFILLSWLLVLSRTRERNEVSFEWTYNNPPDGLPHEATGSHLSMSEVATEPSSDVGHIATAISHHLKMVTPSHGADSLSPVSLLLSTSSLSQTSEEARDEGVLHVELRFRDGQLEARPVWCTENVPQYTVTRYIETLVDTIRMCIAKPRAAIEDCIRPTAHDLDKIWEWNHQLPPSHSFCMHDAISEQAQRCPDNVAISSWDGCLTYTQIEQYSTFMAHELTEMGVQLHDVLPVCFEKSRWTVVAVLAVMKVGATFVLLDPTLPLARLQNTAQQVGAKTMLTSRQQHGLSTSIIPDGKVVVVEENTFTDLSRLQPRRNLAPVPPTALMYIIFTSGSTGVPKGVMISHETYTSSAIPRAEAVGYTEKSRVLDFASYAFDVSIDSMLCTLAQGGCLCIPSDEDRMNDINGVMREMQVNYAGLTPSVARILDSDVIASLSMLGLGGEAVTAKDVTRWGQDTRIVIGYGPCECTIGCTVNSSAATGRDYISIGKGTGAAMWIVDPEDHESLMPVGAVGELLVEGPIVGQGYLNDPAKTAAAFIENPAWLTAGHNAHSGRRGRLYKTGDLGKYDPDGSGGIVFVGRKDTQVKLRGQRVELGEIEYQLKTLLPPSTSVIAEVVTPSGSGGQPTLVAFVASQAPQRHGDSDLKLVQPTGELQGSLLQADEDLAKVLPRYMVPTAYIPINYIPVLISGKTDRKQLRQFAATIDLRQLDHGAESGTNRRLSELEQCLRQAWSQTLKLDAERILPSDNFFALGGDSLMAMRLVSVCREQGLDLTVANAFLHPKLSAMAEVVRTCESQAQMETPALSMISQPVDSACLEAAQACGSDRMAIEDMYPCTPTQEGLFTFSLKSVTPYVAQRLACIPEHIDLAAWRKAWEETVAASPILRTRLVQSSESRLWQVVLKENIIWRQSADLAQYLESDRNEKMDLGQSLARYAIVTPPAGTKRYMVWTIHHVLYDGWSEPLILGKVANALRGQHISTGTQMRDLVRYLQDTDEDAVQEFWRRELEGAVGPQFPRAPSRDYLPTADAMLEHQVDNEASVRSPFTMATLIRGAWSLVASQYMASNDVVLIETLTGRDIPLAGVEGIEGPLIATMPVRIRIDRTRTVESYLQAIQQGMLARTPYQHYGVQNIRKVSSDAQCAIEARTGLVIQPEPEYTGAELGFDQGDVVREALHFNPYPLMLGCGIRKGGFRICASFDSSLINVAQMRQILGQLEAACLRMTKNPSQRLDEISCLPQAELDQIWQWNRAAPLSLEEPSKRLRADARIEPGSIYPHAVVSWVCDPQNPSLLSPIGCVGELWLEGDILSGGTVESPAWLVAGSSNHVGRKGKVQPTGDMVRHQDDGSLIFIGRKENIAPVQGHAVDIADLEAHIKRHFPPGLRAAAAVLQSSSDAPQQGVEQVLIAFIEQQNLQEDGIELMSASHDIISEASSPQSFRTAICAKISLNLAVALKELDRFIQDSLPPYMVPFAYVVVDKIPSTADQIDHNWLNQLASKIPRDVLTRLRASLKDAWTRISAQTDMTATESILRASWAKILGIGPEKIDLDDNFFRLGGDSVLAMKLVADLRLQGHMLTVADVFQHMRLRDAARVLKVDQVSTQKAQPYKPFSTLALPEIGSFLFKIVRPKLSDPKWSIRDVLPVTDSQALDVHATTQAPRTSVQYTMLYFDGGIDQERLLRSCDELVKTHDVLRTVFIEHESSIFQVVVDELHTPVVIKHADTEIERYVTDLCSNDIELNFHLGSPFLRMFYVESTDGRGCLIIGLSHAQYDGVSLPTLLRDLETLYTEGQVGDFEPFSSYMARICDEKIQSGAINYWCGLLDGSSLSILGEASGQPRDKALFVTKPVDISQRPKEITTASLLTAAWALVLARRLQVSDVTFGSVTSGRLIDLANVENVMGPCYQFAPIRVLFGQQWTATDLLLFIQKQTAESAAHDFLGFEKISKQCTQWPSEARFFDSIVHHQDFEDFDTMPFAGGTCKVDISNPHGDAAHPMKIVSLVRQGQMHVGVVGSERNSAFVHAILDELAATVEELAVNQSGHILVLLGFQSTK
ncbi:Nonribosomal peptide synthetase 4 [Exophiala xenobiotica]|nr:Nonribosomal peptide synthetase 4 [Exophiala xenobiotica]KAK5392754.1 Nonribosomal peptide synthetase 4 [Exophiala xenobiotica]KAK5411809.1 Nonribosomal peptide synthetase 4 [Exophiala xenobiotica]KAK5460380.1 Nonribosomal peptide synthetase 4 [Exophiala xenobiotica]KAK5481064.1 Nonribosomal peptide synthetase 4 [Exophiala xenobiotica]